MQKPPLRVVQAYGWEWKTSWDDLRFYASLHLHNAPQILPSSQPSLHFQKGNVDHMWHRKQVDRK